MEQLVAFMLMVGCNADGTQCAEVPVAEPIYESVEACEADLPLQMRFSGTASVRLSAVCKAIDRNATSASTEVAWAMSRSGMLLVEFKAPQMVAEAGAGTIR